MSGSMQHGLSLDGQLQAVLVARAGSLVVGIVFLGMHHQVATPTALAALCQGPQPLLLVACTMCYEPSLLPNLA